MNTTGTPIETDRVQAVKTLVADWPEWERAALRAALRPKPPLKLYAPDAVVEPVTGADLGEFPAVGAALDLHLTEYVYDDDWGLVAEDEAIELGAIDPAAVGETWPEDDEPAMGACVVARN